MTGLQAVHSHQQRVDAAFQRLDGVAMDAELRADFAKYLCIIVAGFTEKAFSEIVLEHARGCGAISLQKFVEQHTGRFNNANSTKILALLGSFSEEWRAKMESYLVDERKAAIDSVYGLRNSIAHGVSVSVTIVHIMQYYHETKKVVAYAQKLCVPKSTR